MFACYFPSFVLLSSVLLPPFLARDSGFLGAWAARTLTGCFFLLSANHEREFDVCVLFFIIRTTFQ